MPEGNHHKTTEPTSRTRIFYPNYNDAVSDLALRDIQHGAANFKALLH